MSRGERVGISSSVAVSASSSAGRSALRLVAGDLLLIGGLLLLLLIGTTVGYWTHLEYALPQDRMIGVYVDGLGEPEQGADGDGHRWAAPFTRLRLPGLGAAAYRMETRFHNPVADHSRTATVVVGDHSLSHYRLRPGWQDLQIDIPAQAIDPASGGLDLVLRIEPPFQAGGRDLGVAIRDLRIEQVTPAQAPWHVQRDLGLGIGLLVVLLRVSGARRRWSGAVAGMLLILALLLIPRARVDLLLALPLLVQSLLISLVAVPLLRWWSHRYDPGVRPWAIAVGLVAIAAFIARFVGMRHPQFVIIDHILRVHQIQAIAIGQRDMVQASLSQQYEWGRDIAVPYSLLSYDLFVPLARWLTRDQLLMVVEGTTAALDASVVPILWSLARRSRLSVWSSWWAAVLFAMFPVGYLYFHDGSYPTIIALWVTVAALWLLAEAMRKQRPGWWIATTLMVALSILMYVTHLVFVPLLLGATVASAVFLGAIELRRRSYMVGAISIIGMLLAIIGYYGAHLPELLLVTIPSYVAALSEQGTVGRDPRLLPGPLLGNTWQQLWGHYRVIGVALAAGGVLLALRQRERWLTHLLVGYALFLIVTSFVDLRFGLWNKHMYFAMPGIALAAGMVLGKLQHHSRLGAVVAWLMFGYFLWTSLDAWILRVVWYIWSLRTL
jgi:hypothetical protein